MAPLNYQRLLARLDKLFVSFEELPDDNRHVNLKKAVKAGQISAQAGHDGDGEVMTPGQLKHWVVKKMAIINEHYDREAAVSPSTSMVDAMHDDAPNENDDSGFFDDAQHQDAMQDVRASIEQAPRNDTGASKENTRSKKQHPATKPAPVKKTSAVNKRLIPNPNATTAGVKKASSKRTTRAKARLASPKTRAAVARSADEQAAAAALLDLFSSRPANHQATSHIAHAVSSSMAPPPAIAVAPAPLPVVYFSGAPASASASFPAPSMNASVTPQMQAYTPLPHYNATYTPQQHFLAGVEYAMRNVAASGLSSHGRPDFLNSFPAHVREQLGKSVEGFSTMNESDGTVESGHRPREMSGAKSFWNVI
jgi:hypothetical protein